MKETVVRFGKIMLIAVALSFLARSAQATDISGTISSTLVITQDSQLVGNVTCTITSGDCIQFGASNIVLSLNGFSISQDPIFVCAVSPITGINTASQSNVTIKGPGVVRGFPFAVQITGGSSNSVNGITISAGNCKGGIFLTNTSGNDVEGNTLVSILDPVVGRLTLDAIAIRTIGNGNTSSNNIVRHNQCVGFTSGVVLLPSGTGSTVTGNLIEGNALLFNEAGVGVGAGATGNVIRRNQVFDNGLTGAIRDIQDNNAAGANTYQNNLCDVSTGTGAAGVCPNVPNFAGHENVSTSQTVANQQ